MATITSSLSFAKNTGRFSLLAVACSENIEFYYFVIVFAQSDQLIKNLSELCE